MLKSFKSPRHIVNLGHGVYPVIFTQKMSKHLLIQLKIMKFNLSITLTLLVFIGSHAALSQKRGKKEIYKF